MSNPAKYFEIYELVPSDVYEELKEEAWKFMDQKLIDTIDFLREEIGLAFTANDYFWGGRNQYRGWRPKTCKVGADKSAHKDGMACDFIVSGKSAYWVRDWIIGNADKLPHPIRIEDGVDWVHVDVRAVKGFKVYKFKP